jgi:hypothetical protein
LESKADIRLMFLHSSKLCEQCLVFFALIFDFGRNDPGFC